MAASVLWGDHPQGFRQECLRGGVQKKGGLGVFPQEKKKNSVFSIQVLKMAYIN